MCIVSKKKAKVTYVKINSVSEQLYYRHVESRQLVPGWGRWGLEAGRTWALRSSLGCLASGEVGASAGVEVHVVGLVLGEVDPRQLDLDGRGVLRSLPQTVFVGTKGTGVDGVDFPDRDLVGVLPPGAGVRMADVTCTAGVEMPVDDGG